MVKSLNGDYLVIISNNKTPKAHVSTLVVYYLFMKISGAIYSQVPQKVFLELDLRTLVPKSASFGQ
jgi:hypothetical protein